MTDRVVVVRQPTLVTVAAPGPQGPPGAAGGAAIVATAGTILSGNRMVTKATDATMVYADTATLAHIAVPLWMTLGAASAGAAVSVQAFGVVVEPSWTWTPGPLYLGTSGLLTQTTPSAAGGAVFLAQIGYATSATAIVLDRFPSIRLT